MYDTDIKVVHLVRDPRAMITSIARRPGVWSSLLKNSTFQCQRMEDDMKLEQGLPKERYVRVRYEDLVDKTEETLEGLYNHLGLLWTDHVRWPPTNSHQPTLQEGGVVPHPRRGSKWHQRPRLLQHLQVEQLRP